MTNLAAKQFHCDLGVSGIPVTYPTIKSYYITVGWHHCATRLLAEETKKSFLNCQLFPYLNKQLIELLQYSERAKWKFKLKWVAFGVSLKTAVWSTWRDSPTRLIMRSFFMWDSTVLVINVWDERAETMALFCNEGI